MAALSEQQVKSLTSAYGEAWKFPLGPYRAAPAEHGGGWWMVNPFTGPAPWDNTTPTEKQLPAGFLEIFGPEPGVGKPGRERWLNDLQYFKRAGTPEWMEGQSVLDALATFNAWGMGAPKFYEGRYGWMARFPASQIPTYEDTAWATVNVTHQVIAGYQIRLLQQGIVPAQRHPYTPAHLFPQ